MRNGPLINHPKISKAHYIEILSVPLSRNAPVAATMCTMDYVHEVLGKQGWERCDCVNDYMAGWEDTPDCSDDDELPFDALPVVETCSVGCQTPKEWLQSEAAQQPTPDERRRAEPRKRALGEGTTSPDRKNRAASLS